MTDYQNFITKTLAEINALPAGGDVLNQLFAGPHLQHSGIWVEFGVGEGASLRRIFDRCEEASVWGFDSFEGLPESWETRQKKGAFKVTHIPLISGVHIVTGLFQDTLPSWHPNKTITLVHIDCDLYSSTSVVLNHIIPFLADGAIIVFDELFNYPGFENHEMKALYEASEAGLKYDWLYTYGGDKKSWPNDSAALKIKNSIVKIK